MWINSIEPRTSTTTAAAAAAAAANPMYCKKKHVYIFN